MLKRTTTTTKVLARQGRSGFTLMEMLVVVAIIVIVAGAATAGVIQYLAQAKVSRAKLDIQKIQAAVVAYSLQHDGLYPGQLADLTQPDGFGNPGVLTNEDLVDPWNNPYHYDANNRTQKGVPRISSGGPTGQSQNLNNETLKAQ